MSSPRIERLRSEEMEWLALNRKRLEADLPGEYVAVAGSALVAHGDNPVEVYKKALELGFPRALIHRVLPKEFQRMKFVR